MYSGCGDIELANKVFVRMSKRDLISQNSIIDVYSILGVAHQLFDLMPERIVVSWNIMINGYLKGLKSLNLNWMLIHVFTCLTLQTNHNLFDFIYLTFILNEDFRVFCACAPAGFLIDGRDYFSQMKMYIAQSPISHIIGAQLIA